MSRKHRPHAIQRIFFLSVFFSSNTIVVALVPPPPSKVLRVFATSVFIHVSKSSFDVALRDFLYVIVPISLFICSIFN